MNYYEELGIDSSATDEEIHKAHRRLTKLLHPDQQLDEGMKRLAETQMRRLNAVVAVLSNPETRRQYDEQQYLLTIPAVNASAAKQALVTPPTAFPIHRRAIAWQRIWRTFPWWVWSTIGALILTFGAVWFFAEDLGSSFGGKSSAYVRPTEKSAEPPAQGSVADRFPEPVAPARKQSALDALSNRILAAIQRSKTGTPSENEPHSPSKQLASTPKTIKPANDTDLVSKAPIAKQPELSPAPALPSADPSRLDVSRLLSKSEASRTPAPSVETNRSTPPAGQVPAPLNTPGKTPPISKPAVQEATASIPPAVLSPPSVPALRPAKDSLAGDWYYAPQPTDKVKPGVFLPEYIDLKLFWDQGKLRGQYKARYQVANSQYAPDVAFELTSADPTSKKFTWEGHNGSRGVLRINPIDPGVIKVEWKTTVRSRRPALTLGFATLVRRSD